MQVKFSGKIIMLIAPVKKRLKTLFAGDLANLIDAPHLKERRFAPIG